MAGQPLTDELLARAIGMLCVEKGLQASEGEHEGKKRWLLSPGDIIVTREDGKISVQGGPPEEAPKIWDALCELTIGLKESGLAQEPNTDPEEERRPRTKAKEPAPVESGLTSRINATVQASPEAWAGTFLRKLLDLFDSDVLEIFGDTGVGKTIFCQTVAEEASQRGARVIYIDTEKNVGRKVRERLAKLQGWKELRFIPGAGIKDQVMDPGLYYLYTPSLQELSTITRNLPDADLVIIDSLGMPVLVKYSRMKQNEQGHVLQEMIAIKGDLKEWAYRTGGLAIDVNQPVSDMNKTPQQIREGLYPFGDKSGFATKSVLRFWKIKDEEGRSVIEGKIHKSRDFGKGTKLIDMEITDHGVQIRIKEAA